MKSHPRRHRNLFGLLVALAVAPGLAALTPTEWQYRQALHVSAAGLVRVQLTPASFDAAGLNQEDLRVIDANGTEMASLLDAPPIPVARALRPESFEVKLDAGATVITLTTGTSAALAGVTLETPQPFFLRAARVEISLDGSQWTMLDQGLPLFRQWGAEKLSLPLGGKSGAFLRIVVTDSRAAGLTVTGASLQLSAAPAPALVAVGTRIARRDEFAGETVLTLDLAGRHLPLAALEFSTSNPLFMRHVTVTVREVHDGASAERIVGTGTIYRVALEGAPARAQLEVPLNFTPATREVLVHLHNGDSPPLGVDDVTVKRRPVDLQFVAPAPGTYLLLTGNPQATAPHYDLAGFSAQLRDTPALAVVPGNLEATPDYRPSAPLDEGAMAEVPLTGAPLDISDWAVFRTIVIEHPGVQELELDAGILAHVRPDYADVRVMHEGNQIPYVLEQPALTRSVTVPPLPMPDPKRPTVSIWQLRLWGAGGGFRRIVLTTRAPLFQRDFRIYEKVPTPEGRNYEHTLASGRWSRTPGQEGPETRTFEFTDPLQTATLWIETDNGDNPALTLGAAAVIYPVVRLIFKTAAVDGFRLANGYPSAVAPRYDLSLVAEKLLTSPRNVATMFSGGADAGSRRMAKVPANGYVFWAALALVVVVLLVIVAKLLPKPPAT